jgi:hypothetical protein
VDEHAEQRLSGLTGLYNVLSDPGARFNLLLEVLRFGQAAGLSNLLVPVIKAQVRRGRRRSVRLGVCPSDARGIPRGGRARRRAQGSEGWGGGAPGPQPAGLPRSQHLSICASAACSERRRKALRGGRVTARVPSTVQLVLLGTHSTERWDLIRLGSHT